MNEAPLPPNVYRLAQRYFDAIPGAPWAYWLSSSVRMIFEQSPKLGEIARPVVGLQTSDNPRFLRMWWEIGITRIVFDCRSIEESRRSSMRWFPHIKGGEYLKWYGNREYVVNWWQDGSEIRNFFTPAGKLASRPQNTRFYFRSGVTWTHTTAKGMSVRWLPHGSICNVEGMAAYPTATDTSHEDLIGVLNSEFATFALNLINPTIHYGANEVVKFPFPELSRATSETFEHVVRCSVQTQAVFEQMVEAAFDFVVPPKWDTGISDMSKSQTRLIGFERQINDNVYHIYGISDADRAAIEAELAGGALDHEVGEDDEDTKPEEREEETTAGAMTREELAVRWISYVVGVVLGRFRPGVDGALGRAVYRRDDFAIGSLPAPDEAQFDELVGPVERFAYVDADGGRHIFPAEVEQALRALALPDGIAVLEEGHPRDLPALVEKALRLMLDPPKLPMVNPASGDASSRQLSIVNAADEVIALGANGDLRKFLEKDFFTKWHLKWYRKRPVYWPLQSAKRGYGFVLFHEKVEKYTLYVLLRDYLDHKLNGLRLQIEDLLALAAGQAGAARRQTERQLDRARQLLDEVNVFAQAIDRIAKGGYQPEANWIDDGVILRLAPLWELIPNWKAEPKKTWERLEQGDYDWSHIAMAYWPDRVRAACRTNKSVAIAHGHEEWYDSN